MTIRPSSNRASLRTATIATLGALVLAGVALLNATACRRGPVNAPATPAAARSPTTQSGAPATAPSFDAAERAAILARVHRGLIGSASGGSGAGELRDRPASDFGGASSVRAVVSVARAEATAWVAQGEAATLNGALDAAAASLVDRLDQASQQALRATPPGTVIKVDLAVSYSPPHTFAYANHLPRDIDASREGVWLPAGGLLLLPEELSARGLVDEGTIRTDRLTDYLAEGPRRLAGEVAADRTRLSGYVKALAADNTTAQRVQLASFATVRGGAPISLFRGNQELPGITPPDLLAAARRGGDFLLRHQLPSGVLAYQYQPRTDRFDEGKDNLLRQAGTAFSLVELAVEGPPDQPAASRPTASDPRILAAAERAIRALLTNARPFQASDGSSWLAISDDSGEAKLGGAALAILAITRCHTAGGCADLLDEAKQLAAFLRHQQKPTGQFESKYFFDDDREDDFESIYYPGEAVFALASLHGLDPRSGWLEVAMKGADWLIGVRDVAKETNELPHDHWLLLGIDELDRQLADQPALAAAAARYRRHAERIASAILAGQRRASTEPDWLGSYYDPPRSTPTATRAEGMVAMTRLGRRHPEAFDAATTARYLEALRLMAEFQLRTQITPENAIYLPRPDRALGGFRRSLTSWAVRIDYVQHNISALLGLRRLILEEVSEP